MLYVGIDIVLLAAFGAVLCIGAWFGAWLKGMCRHDRDVTVAVTFLTSAFMVIGYAVIATVLDMLF